MIDTPAFAIAIESTLDKPCGDPALDEMFRKGRALMKHKKYDKAADLFTAIMKKKPDHFAAIEQMGIIARELGQHEKSLLFFKALTEHVPTYAQAYGQMASTLVTLERYDEAIRRLQQALALGNPVFAHAGLGACYKFIGNDDLAGEHSRKAMELSYNSPDALYNCLLFHHTFKNEDDPHLQHVLNLMRKQDKKLPPLALAMLYTVLFKAYEEIKDYDKAMKYAALAGAVRKKESGYVSGKDRVAHQALAQYFSKDYFTKTETSGNDSRLPVFILAMPRSGTTLLEQILHSHRDVVGIGEDRNFGTLLNEKSTLPSHAGTGYLFRTKPAQSGSYNMAQLADAHLAYLKTKGPNAKRIVDKAIANYCWAGAQYLAFPKAFFIHLTRDPLSTAISAYTRNFVDNVHPYTNDLYDLGQAFRLHHELMEHWKKVLPAPILTVAYEDLVEDTEKQVRRILEFLDLPWDENCLEFHKTKKVVKTASVQQVRKPIYKDSLETWRKYEKHLAPLVEGLGPYAPPESLYILEKYGKKEKTA